MASHDGYVRLGETPSPSKCCGCCKTWSRAQRAVCAGVLCLILGGVFGGVLAFARFIVEQKIADAVVLKKGSATEKEWQSPEAPVYNKFYFLDVNNPYEIRIEGAKPSFTERGPYTYREHRIKQNLSWSEDEETVSYLSQDYFVFDQSLSVGDPMEDQVTTLNYILVSAFKFLNESSIHDDPGLEKFVSFILSLLPHESLFITRSVHDLIWGYDDTLLELVNKVNNSIPKRFPLQNNVSTVDTKDICRVQTGVGNLSELGQFLTWNNMTYLPYWNGSEAQELRGTEGYFFKPGIGKDPIYVFVDFLYRSGYFSFNRTEMVKGIDVNRFTIPEIEMENATMNSDNADYYSYGPSGLFNMTTCLPMNAPVFISKPHFLDCSPIVLEAVDNLHPDRALHDSFLDVEPMTGVMFRGAKRLQMNILLKRNKDIVQLQNVPSLYFPIFWVEETGEITDHLVAEFKSQLYTPVSVINNTLIGLMIASGLCAMLCFLLAAWFKFSDHTHNYAINDNTI